MNTTAELLVRADHHARDSLLDTSPDRAELLFRGWAEVMDTAATLWQALPSHDDLNHGGLSHGDPLAQVQAIAASVYRDATGWRNAVSVDDRMLQIADLFSQATQQSSTGRLSPVEATQARAGLLHTCYVASHAAATSTRAHADRLLSDPGTAVAGARMAVVSDRVAAAEQILDAHLHQTPPPASADSPAAALAQAITGWTVAVHSMAATQPDAKNWHTVAQVGVDVLAQTARIAQARQPGATTEVQQRLLPALKQSLHAWTATRRTWAVLASPDTPTSRPLVAAARQLQQALRQPGITTDPRTPNLLTTALAAGFEAATLSQRAISDPGLRAPADTVVALTRQHFAQHGQPDHHVWAGLERVEGRAPITIPAPLRNNLAQTAAVTTTAAKTACSAAHLLLDTSGYATQVAFHTGKTVSRQPRPPGQRVTQPSRGIHR